MPRNLAIVDAAQRRRAGCDWRPVFIYGNTQIGRLKGGRPDLRPDKTGKTDGHRAGVGGCRAATDDKFRWSLFLPAPVAESTKGVAA